MLTIYQTFIKKYKGHLNTLIKDLVALFEEIDKTAPTTQVLTYGGTTTMDLSTGEWAEITLLGNITSFVFNGLKAGDAGIIFVKQGGTGSYTINWESAKLPVGGLSLSTAVGSVTVVGYIFDGTNVFLSKENYGVI